MGKPRGDDAAGLSLPVLIRFCGCWMARLHFPEHNPPVVFGKLKQPRGDDAAGLPACGAAVEKQDAASELRAERLPLFVCMCAGNTAASITSKPLFASAVFVCIRAGNVHAKGSSAASDSSEETELFSLSKSFLFI